MSDFAQLLETQIPRLRRYGRDLTRDASRVDDVVQSCPLRTVAKQHLWQAGTDLRAWLFTILHNQNVNHAAARCGLAPPRGDIFLASEERPGALDKIEPTRAEDRLVERVRRQS